MSERTRTTPEWTEHWDEIAHRVDCLLPEGQEVEFVGGALVVFSEPACCSGPPCCCMCHVRDLRWGTRRIPAVFDTWPEAFDAARERHYPILAYVGGEYACVFPSGHCETKR